MAASGIRDDQLEQLLAEAIAHEYRRKYGAYAREGFKRDQIAMYRYAQELQKQGGKKGGMKLIRAMTPEQDEFLREIAPDGNPDWHLNPDFLKFLPKTTEFEFLKQFKLHEVPPEDLGYKPRKEKKDEKVNLVGLSPGAGNSSSGNSSK